jgi:hypothetical protein
MKGPAERGLKQKEENNFGAQAAGASVVYPQQNRAGCGWRCESPVNLAVLYGASWFLEPTFHAHATNFGPGARLRPTEEGGNSSVKILEPDEASAFSAGLA